MVRVGKALSLRVFLLMAAAVLATMTGCAAQVVDEPGAEELRSEEDASLLVDGTLIEPGTVTPGEGDEAGEENENPEPTPWLPPTREETRSNPEPTPWKEKSAQAQTGGSSSSESGSHN